MRRKKRRYLVPGLVAASFIADVAGKNKILLGPAASGKTVASIFALLRIALETKTARFLIVTTSQHEQEYMLRALKEWVPIGTYDQATEQFNIEALNYAGTPIDITMQFFLYEKDSVDKIVEQEFTTVLFDRIGDMDSDFVTTVAARGCRYPRPTTGPSFIGTNSLPVFRSWLYSEHIDSDSDVVFYKQPSALSAEAENLRNLPEDYYPSFIDTLPEDDVKRLVTMEYPNLIMRGSDCRHFMIVGE